MKYLGQRNGVFRYRRAYPLDIQSRLGREYTVSLKTRDRGTAAIRYAEQDKVFETRIAVARDRIGNEYEIQEVRQIAHAVGFTTLPDHVERLPIGDLIQISAQNLQVYSDLPKGHLGLLALGQTVSSKLSIDEVFEEYRRLHRDTLRRKSNRELNKFLAPIRLAIHEFKEFAGNVDVLKLKNLPFSDFATN